MQKEIRDVYVQKIKEGLSQLKANHVEFFERLYPGGVDKIQDAMLDHCLMQVTNTVETVKRLKSKEGQKCIVVTKNTDKDYLK